MRGVRETESGRIYLCNNRLERRKAKIVPTAVTDGSKHIRLGQRRKGFVREKVRMMSMKRKEDDPSLVCCHEMSSVPVFNYRKWLQVREKKFWLTSQVRFVKINIFPSNFQPNWHVLLYFTVLCLSTALHKCGTGCHATISFGIKLRFILNELKTKNTLPSRGFIQFPYFFIGSPKEGSYPQKIRTTMLRVVSACRIWHFENPQLTWLLMYLFSLNKTLFHSSLLFSQLISSH